MNLMNLFRKPKAQPVVDAQPSEGDVVVDPSVFAEAHPPVADVQAVTPPSVSRLEKFLRVDYEWYGYSDGYANPSADFLDMKLRTIRSDFRLELDRSLDDLRTRCSEARLHAIRISGMPGRMLSEIEEKIHQLDASIQELERQKVLSVDDEGMIASAISRYSVGFTKGVHRYQQEKHFASETGLF